LERQSIGSDVRIAHDHRFVKISHLRLVRSPSTARAEALVTWEESPRPSFELYFETDWRGVEDLSPEPEAFLTACLVHAAENGERRVLVEGAVCPQLVEGGAAAVGLLGKWFGSPRGPIAIEATNGLRALRPRNPARSASFLTGGIDSLHLLGTNRSRYPPDHPDFFADCLSVYGHLCAESDRSPWYERALVVLSGTAEEADLQLVPVWTNLWRLDPDLSLVADKSLGSALAATAHLFRGRWSRVTIASGRDVVRERPRGTHPLLDPLYSSSAVEIRHRASPFTRFERLRAIAGFRPGLESLVVCLAYPEPPYLNCGRCEKCVRTMTCLLALGLLERARHFPPRQITPEVIEQVSVGPNEADYWTDALPALAEKGRNDLVAAVQKKIAEARRVQDWHRDAGLKGRLRRFDRRHLGGRLLSLRRRFST
jgi:hypothetical protein